MVGVIVLSCFSGILYRFGGSAKEGNFLDFFRNKLTRRVGCAAIQFITIFFVLKISAPWWVHLASIGITWGFLSTYWDFINGEDRHGFHGVGIACGMILYVITGSIPIVPFILRVIILGVCMEMWSRMHTSDIWEECGRGVFIPLSLLILL